MRQISSLLVMLMGCSANEVNIASRLNKFPYILQVPTHTDLIMSMQPQKLLHKDVILSVGSCLASFYSCPLSSLIPQLLHCIAAMEVYYRAYIVCTCSFLCSVYRLKSPL